jgi:hypothetical protein
LIEPEITLQFEIIARGYIVVKDTGKKIAAELCKERLFLSKSKANCVPTSDYLRNYVG